MLENVFYLYFMCVCVCAFKSLISGEELCDARKMLVRPCVRATLVESRAGMPSGRKCSVSFFEPIPPCESPSQPIVVKAMFVRSSVQLMITQFVIDATILTPSFAIVHFSGALCRFLRRVPRGGWYEHPLHRFLPRRPPRVDVVVVCISRGRVQS